jgi:hypothetical protein
MKNLNNLVCSLELSKKLKELGVKQGSYFWWNFNEENGWVVEDKIWEFGDNGRDCIKSYSAYTSGELGELFPKEEWFTIERKVGMLSNKLKWFVTNKLTDKVFTAETLANAMAKMLVYLLENELIKL